MRRGLVLLAAVVVLAAAGRATAAPVAPRILFTSVRSGVEEVYSVRTDGSGLAQLTFQGAGLAQAPNPSPNGRYVAYVANQSGYPNWLGGADVLTASGKLAGSISRWDLSSAAWSPDSKWLVSPKPSILSTPAGLVLLRAPHLSVGSNLTTTSTLDISPSWSPGGKAIAFLRSTGLGTWDLMVLRKGQLSRLASTNATVTPAWSADGKQIAFATATDTDVVPSRGGIVRRVLDAPARLIAWPPDGSDLAVSNDNGVSVIAADGTAQRLTGIDLTSLVWADALYGTDGTRLLRIGLNGEVRTLFQSIEGDAVGGSRLWRPPAGTTFHAPQPATETRVAQATPDELETDASVDALAADGDAVTVAVGCTPENDPRDIELVWHGGASDYAGPRIPGACTLVPDDLRIGGLALAGDTPVVVRGAGGISTFFWELYVGATEVATVSGVCCAGDPLRGEVSDVFAQRDTAVYSTWELCTYYPLGACTGDLLPSPSKSEYRITRQHIYTVRNGITAEVFSAPGEHTPLAVDNGRIAVRSHSTTLDLIDLNGEPLLSIRVGATILQAALAGGDAVVLVPGALRVYNASTGALTDTWPLPAAIAGGPCRQSACNDVDLVGTANGRAAYTLNGRVYLVRLADGFTTALALATHARLTTAGLFYSFVGALPWPGRVRFVPTGQLP